MDTIQLLILEKDKEYGRALSMAVSNLHNEFHISLCSLSDLNHQDLERFQMILIGGYEEGELEEIDFKSDHTIWLMEEQICDEGTDCKKSENPKLQIYKYSKVSDIVSNLRFFYGLLSGKKVIIKSNLKTEVIGFYSACGGTGKTVVSISTARELSRYHDKKVLYLNFEEIAATTLYMQGGSDQRGISDFLYYLFEKKSDTICSYLDSFTYADLYGVNTFYHNEGRNELKQLEKDELMYFMKSLLDSHQYDFVILDLSCDLRDETLCLLEYCEQVVYISLDDIIQSHKKEIFMNYISRWNAFQPADRFIEVINQSSFNQNQSEDRVDLITNQTVKQIRIEKDANSFSMRNNSIDISINHVLGLGIKRLTNEILGIS